MMINRILYKYIGKLSTYLLVYPINISCTYTIRSVIKITGKYILHSNGANYLRFIIIF